MVTVMMVVMVDWWLGLVVQAKEAYAVVHTGETALYGNIILQKGVIPSS